MKKLLSILLIVTMIFSLTACGNKTASETSTNEGATESDATKAEPTAEPTKAATTEATTERPTEGSGIIGISYGTLSNEFFVNFDGQFHNAFEAGGYKVTSVSCEGNAATQVSDIENLITMGCEAIFLFMVDPEAVTDVLLKAREAGIKVFPIAGAPQNRDAYDYMIGTDQRGTGVQEAEIAAEWIEKTFPNAEDGSIQVALVTNTSSEQMVQRLDGMKTIEEICSKAKIVEVYDVVGATSETPKAQEYADLMQAQYPDLKVIMAYGCDTALAVNEVYMKDSSLNQSEFAVFSVDTSAAIYTAIAGAEKNEALIRGTISFGTDLGIETYKVYTGQYELADDGNFYLPLEKITKENVANYLK